MLIDFTDLESGYEPVVGDEMFFELELEDGGSIVTLMRLELKQDNGPIGMWVTVNDIQRDGVIVGYRPYRQALQ